MSDRRRGTRSGDGTPGGDGRTAGETEDHRWLVAWGLGSVAFGAASVLVPVYLVQTGGGPVDLGVLAGVAALVASPGAVVWGRLADRTENGRAVVLSSLVVVAAALCAMPVLSTTASVVVANAVLWLAGGAVGPVLTLLVVAGVPPAEWSREIALLNTYQGFGWAGGLLLGGAWTATAGRVVPPVATQRLLFLVCALVVVAAVALLARDMPGPSPTLDRTVYRRATRVLAEARRSVHAGSVPFVPTRPYWTTPAFARGRLLGRVSGTLAAYYAVAAAVFAGFAGFFAPLPAFLLDAGYGPGATYGLYLVAGLGAAAAYGPAGELGVRYDLRVLHAGALGVRGAAIPVVAAAGTALGPTVVGLAAVGAAFALVGVSWAVVAVTAGTIVARLAPDRARGEALGVHAALTTLATGVGSVAGGVVARRVGFVAAFGAAGALVVAGAVAVAALRSISRDVLPGDVEPASAPR